MAAAPGEDGEYEAAAAAALVLIAAMGGAPILGEAGANHAFHICGATTDPQKEGLRSEGLTSFHEMALLPINAAETAVQRLGRRPVNRGGVTISVVVQFKLEALLLWLHRKLHEGVDLQTYDARNFTNRAMEDMLVRRNVHQEDRQQQGAANGVAAPQPF